LFPTTKQFHDHEAGYEILISQNFTKIEISSRNSEKRAFLYIPFPVSMDILTTDVILMKLFNEGQASESSIDFLAAFAMNAGHAKDPQVLLVLKTLYDSELLTKNNVRKNFEMLWAQWAQWDEEAEDEEVKAEEVKAEEVN